MHTYFVDFIVHLTIHAYYALVLKCKSIVSFHFCKHKGIESVPGQVKLHFSTYSLLQNRDRCLLPLSHTTVTTVTRSLLPARARAALTAATTFKLEELPTKMPSSRRRKWAISRTC